MVAENPFPQKVIIGGQSIDVIDGTQRMWQECVNFAFHVQESYFLILAGLFVINIIAYFGHEWINRKLNLIVASLSVMYGKEFHPKDIRNTVLLWDCLALGTLAVNIYVH